MSQEDLAIEKAVIREVQAIVKKPPPTAAFGARGLVCEKLGRWIDEGNPLIRRAVEAAITRLYPFTVGPDDPEDKIPLATLRRRFVLESTLPIEIAYAGEDDLPTEFRTALQSLSCDITFLNLLEIFSDETLDLRHGGRAMRPFAVLASTFEETISPSADSIFLQRPEVLLDEHEGYGRTGALLFHGHLLRQNVSNDHTKWLHEQIQGRVPSAALSASLVWNENLAEDGDFGVVVVNKQSARIVMGLLHIAWQNSKDIRDEWTYDPTESWWLGLELCGVPYSFEEHYGGVLGVRDEHHEQPKICGSAIAHTDEQQELLYFTGSLLKNKALNASEYWIPPHWMVDGLLAKGATNADMSCVTRDIPRDVSHEAYDVLRLSVEKALELDERFKTLIMSHR